MLYVVNILPVYSIEVCYHEGESLRLSLFPL